MRFERFKLVVTAALSVLLAASPGMAFAQGADPAVPVIADELGIESEQNRRDEPSKGPGQEAPAESQMGEEAAPAAPAPAESPKDESPKDEPQKAEAPEDETPKAESPAEAAPVDEGELGTEEAPSAAERKESADAAKKGDAAADAAKKGDAAADPASEAMADEDAKPAAEGDDGGLVAQSAAKPVLHTQAHVENEGWMAEKSVGGGRVVVGTTGRGLRVEAVKLWVTGASGAIEGRAHVQNDGWQSWTTMSPTKAVGTSGRALRVEAMRLRLSGSLRDAGYSLYYRLHVQDFGWLGWAKDGELAGTAGYGKRAESIELCLVGPGEEAPSEGGSPYRDAGFVGSAHVQNVGWQGNRTGYSFTVGTTGRGLRVEALTLSRPADDRSGDVIYEAHVQNIGWQGERKNGQVAGTSGQALRLEALRVRLTGDLDAAYDVWYRVHAQDIGWMGWAKDGEKSGTQGLSKRLEAVQIAFVAKGAPAPSSGDQAVSLAFFDGASARLSYRSDGQGWVSGGATSGTTGQSRAVTGIAAQLEGIDGSVHYSASVSGGGWTSEAADGGECGGGRVEAVRFRLSGEASHFLDVWYRAHVSNIGWLDWACNGAEAGSTGMSLPVEAYQVRLMPKGSGAPGSTTRPCARRVTGDQEMDIILTNIIRNVTGTGPDALRKAYNYMMGFSYTAQNELPKGSNPTWEVAYAKEMYKRGSGNCYRYASLMSIIARALGYNTKTIAGEVKISTGAGPHGWTEIYLNGGTYLLDPNFERAFGRNFYLVNYDNSPAIYYR